MQTFPAITASRLLGRLLVAGLVLCATYSSADALVLEQPQVIASINPAGPWAAVQLPDGRIVVGGDFGALGGKPREGIGVLNANGSLDAGWNARCRFGFDVMGPFRCRVYTILRTPDGSILVGGRFRTIGGVARASLAKLSPVTGTADAQWNPIQLGMGDRYADVVDMALVSGAVVVAIDVTKSDSSIERRVASFALGGAGAENWSVPGLSLGSSIEGDGDQLLFAVSTGGLAKLNPASGAIDPAWSAPSVTSVSSMSFDMASQSLFVATSARLFKVRGTMPAVDPQWNPAASLPPLPRLFASGHVYLQVSDPSSSTGNGFQRYSTSGSGVLDASFAPASESSILSALVVLADGGVVIKPDEFYAEQSAPNGTGVMRLHASGAVDAGFDSAAYFLGNIENAAEANDGSVVVVGNFNRLNGRARPGIARLRPDLTLDPTWIPPTIGGATKNAVAIDGSGRVYVSARGWGFAQPTPARLVRFLPESTTIDSAWNPSGNAGSAGSEVNDLLVDQALGWLYLGGGLGNFGPFTTCGLVRRGSLRVTLGAPCIADASWFPDNSLDVERLLQDGQGRVYLAGGFDLLNGQIRNGLARYSASGVLDPGFAPIDATTVRPWLFGLARSAGSLYVAGRFDNFGGVARNGIAKMDLATSTVDASWNPSGGEVVTAVGAVGVDVIYYAAVDDDAIPGGARLTSLQRTSASGNGTIDPTWINGLGNGTLTRMVPSREGMLFVMGEFVDIGGVERAGIAALGAAPISIFSNGFE